MVDIVMASDSKAQLRTLAMLRGQAVGVCPVLGELAHAVLMGQEQYLRRFDAKTALAHVVWMVDRYSGDAQHGDVMAMTFRLLSLVLEFVPGAYDAAMEHHKTLIKAASACMHRGLCGQWRYDVSDARALIEECLRTIKFVARDDVTGGLLRYASVGDLLTVCADKDTFLARQALETLLVLCGKVVMPSALDKPARKSGFFAFFRSRKRRSNSGASAAASAQQRQGTARACSSPANSRNDSNLMATSNSRNNNDSRSLIMPSSSSTRTLQQQGGATSLVTIQSFSNSNYSVDNSNNNNKDDANNNSRGGDGSYGYYTPTSPHAANKDHPIVVQVERVMAPFLVALAEQLAAHLVEAPETWSRLELTLQCIGSLIERALLCHRGGTARALVPPPLPLLLFRLMNMMDDGVIVLDAAVRAERVLLCETLLCNCAHCHRERMVESLLSAPARRFFHRLLDSSREEITTLLNDPFAHGNSNSNSSSGSAEHDGADGVGGAWSASSMRRRDRNQMTCVAALRLLLLACPDVPSEAHGPRPRLVLPVHMWYWEDELRHPNRFSEDNCEALEAAWQRLCRSTVVHSVTRQLHVDLQAMLMNRDIRGAQRNLTRRAVPFVFHFVAEAAVRPEVAVKQSGPQPCASGAGNNTTTTTPAAAAAAVEEEEGGGGNHSHRSSSSSRTRRHHRRRTPSPRPLHASSSAAAPPPPPAYHVAVAAEYLELLCSCAVHMTGHLARQLTTCACAAVLHMALRARGTQAGAAAAQLIERAMRPLCDVFRDGLSSSDKSTKTIVLSMMEWLLLQRQPHHYPHHHGSSSSSSSGSAAAVAATSRSFCVAAFRCGLHRELEVQAAMAARAVVDSAAAAAAAAAAASSSSSSNIIASSLPLPSPLLAASSAASTAVAMLLAARDGTHGSGDAAVAASSAAATASALLSSPPALSATSSSPPSSSSTCAAAAALSRTAWIAQRARRLCTQMLSEVQSLSLAAAAHPATASLSLSAVASSSSGRNNKQQQQQQHSASSPQPSVGLLLLSVEAAQLRTAADALARVACVPGEHVAELRHLFDVLCVVRDVTSFEVHHMDVAGTLLRYVLGGRSADELFGSYVVYSSGGHGSTRSAHIEAAAARHTTPLEERSPWARLMAQGMRMSDILRRNAEARRLRCLRECGVACPTAVRRLITHLVPALQLQAHLPLVESVVTYDAVVCRSPQRALQLMHACTPKVQLCTRAEERGEDDGSGSGSSSYAAQRVDEHSRGGGYGIHEQRQQQLHAEQSAAAASAADGQRPRHGSAERVRHDGVHCPRGHVLVETRHFVRPVVCDVCGASLSGGFSCRRCNYDVCVPCRTQRTQRSGSTAASSNNNNSSVSSAAALVATALLSSVTPLGYGDDDDDGDGGGERGRRRRAHRGRARRGNDNDNDDDNGDDTPLAQRHRQHHGHNNNDTDDASGSSAAASSSGSGKSERAHPLACVGDIERWFRTGSTSTKATQTAPTTQSALAHVRPFTHRAAAFLRRYEDDDAVGALVRKLLADAATLRHLVAEVLRTHVVTPSLHASSHAAAATAAAGEATTRRDGTATTGGGGDGGASGASPIAITTLTATEQMLARSLLQEAIESRYVLYRPLLGVCAYQETLFSVLYRHAFATGNRKMLLTLENVLLQNAYTSAPLTLSDDAAHGEGGGGGDGDSNNNDGGDAVTAATPEHAGTSTSTQQQQHVAPPTDDALSDDYAITSSTCFVFHHMERDECAFCACGRETRVRLATNAPPRLVRTLPNLAHRSDMLLLILLHSLFYGTHTTPRDTTLPPSTTTTTTTTRTAAGNKNSDSSSSSQQQQQQEDDEQQQEKDDELFVSTAITAAVVRAFEASALRISALPPQFALPRWVNFVLRDARFLIPLPVRIKLARFIACDARRALVKHVRRYRGGSASRELRGGGGAAAIAPAEWARLSNHKFVVRRDHFLHDATRLLRKSADARLPVSFEFAGEVGMGQGPTAQFYTTLAREVCRPRLRMWRDGDVSRGNNNNNNNSNNSNNNSNRMPPVTAPAAVEVAKHRDAAAATMTTTTAVRARAAPASAAAVRGRVSRGQTTNMHTVPSVAELAAQTRAGGATATTTRSAATATATSASSVAGSNNSNSNSSASQTVTSTTMHSSATAAEAAARAADESGSHNVDDVDEALVLAPAEGLYPRPFDDVAPLLLCSSDDKRNTTSPSSSAAAAGARVSLYDTALVLRDLVMEQQERAAAYYAVGAALGRAFLDGQTFPLPLSPALALFLRRGLPPYHVTCDAAVAHVVGLQRPVDVFGLATDVLRLVDERVWRSLVTLRGLDAATLRALELPFTLPGHDDVELVAGGAHTYVDAHSVAAYEQRVTAALLYESVTLPLRMLTMGCHDVVPREALAMLENDEMVGLLCGDARGVDAPLWTLQEIRGVLVGEHGYDATSPQLGMLARVLSTRLTPREQRLFLQFCTGCPRLPVGGVAALGAITVVRRSNAFERTLTAAMREAQHDDVVDDDDERGGGTASPAAATATAAVVTAAATTTGSAAGATAVVSNNAAGGHALQPSQPQHHASPTSSTLLVGAHTTARTTAAAAAVAATEHADKDDDVVNDSTALQYESPLQRTDRDAATTHTSDEDNGLAGLVLPLHDMTTDSNSASNITNAPNHNDDVGRQSMLSLLESSVRSVGSTSSNVMSDTARSMATVATVAAAAQTTSTRRSCGSTTSLPSNEWALPSVNTCFRYLKLPPYPTEELMYSKLLLSITQSGDRFELS